jgi:hypothetical protein
MQERYEDYMRRRMREEDEKEGIRPMPSVYDLQKRIDKMEIEINILKETIRGSKL